MGQAVTAINPLLLIWARERTGKRIEDVAEALGKPAEVIAAWESGTAAPTYPQLETLAYKIYRRPIAIFFFPEPPDEPDPEHSFRTLPDFELEELSADTRFKIRQARSFQISLYELNGGANPARSLIFWDINVRGRSSAQVAEEVRRHLGISFETQARDWRGPAEAFKRWRSAIEEKGVFVFKDALKQDDVSGFCLYDAEYPVLYINNSLPATRQVFTLLHELAHILFATNGVTKVDDGYIRSLTGEAKRIENFCRRFAADLAPLHESQSFPEAPISLSLPDCAPEGQRAWSLALQRQVGASPLPLKSRRDVGSDRCDDDCLRPSGAFEMGGGVPGAKAPGFMPVPLRGGKDERQNVALSDDGDPDCLSAKYLRLAFGRFYEGALSMDQLADPLNVHPGRLPDLEQHFLAKPAA